MRVLDLSDQRLDLRVTIKRIRTRREQLVSTHATLGEVPNAALILSPIGMCIKMLRAGVALAAAGTFQKTDQKERALDVLTAKAQVLIVATDLLAIEVDVEQLVRLHRLRDGVNE